MKKYHSVVLIVLLFMMSNCVQKSYQKTIVVKLHVSGIKNIESVGIRGNDQPLSWEYDLELKPLYKDSIYTTTFSMLTAYKFTEAKFVVDGQFELLNSDNRKIYFGEQDTTYFEATYNQVSN